jgi:hypothetical protein
MPPSLIDLPTGCSFHPRCAFARDRCRIEAPLLRGEGHQAACHFSEELHLGPPAGPGTAPSIGEAWSMPAAMPSDGGPGPSAGADA